MLSVHSRIQPRPAVLWREMRGQLIVLNTAGGRYFNLHGSAAAIWRLIDRHGRLDLLLQEVASGHDAPAVVFERDVREFIDAAVGEGLLEIDAEPAPASAGRSADGTILGMGRSSLTVRDSLEALRADFDRQHYVRLPQLIDPSVLTMIERRLDEERFVDRTHEGIGNELCLVPGITTSALQLMFNDPVWLDVVAGVTGCGPVGCFDGRVYRMAAAAGHYDSWHSDVGEDRLVAISVNLSPEPYEGGVLEIRHASSQERLCAVPNGDFGSAVLFRVSPTLRHRVTAIHGARPRTAYAGWFRSSPDFQDLFFGSLPKD